MQLYIIVMVGSSFSQSVIMYGLIVMGIIKNFYFKYGIGFIIYTFYRLIPPNH